MRHAAGRALLLALILLTLAACSEQLHSWRPEARTAIEIARGKGGKTFLPEEFADLENAFRQGELLLADDEDEEAEQFYLLALTKGKLLSEEVDAERMRRERAERQQQQEEARRASEREQRSREEAAEKHRKQELAAAKARAAEIAARAEAERRAAEKSRQQPLAASHTVKRGETLPQIAAQSDVYNDAALWPLLYRTNRDQIRDPRVVWPGQVLSIPRNLGRDDVAEARRYNHDHPLH